MIITLNGVFQIMKFPLCILLSTTGLILFSPFFPLHAQSNCYMQGSNGQSIDLGGLCHGNSSPSTSASSNKNVVQIPIKRRVSGIPTVDITFNGKQTFEMLFDTGASGIMITTDMAESIGVKTQKTAYSQTAGGVVPIGIGQVNSAASGKFVVRNLPVSINPSHPMSLGLLGQTFYQNYDVTIKEKVIELRPRL